MRAILRHHVALLLILFALALPPAAGQAAPAMPTPQQLLRAAADSLDWVNHYSSVTNVRYRASSGEGTRPLLIGTDSKVTKYRDGDRLHIITDFIDHLSPTGDLARRASRRETVYGPDGRADGHQYARTGWWYPADEPTSGSAQVAKSPARTSKMRLVDECDSNTGAFLDGYVDGLGNVIDLAIAGTLAPTAQREEIDHIDCSIVESRSKDTAIRLWIAPAKGNLVIRYLLEQSDGPTGNTRAEFQASGLQDIGDRTIVRAGRASRTWVDLNTHAKWSETVEAQRIDLNLHPDFDQPGLFTTHDVPNGIRVFLDELPDVGVDFVWSNGRPIAKVETELFSELGDSVQQTIAGKVADAVPIKQVMATEKGGDDGEQRISQLWMALLGSAALATFLLIGVALKRRILRAS